MKKTLVIGASMNPLRYSFKAISLLREYGHPVEAIGLKQWTIGDVAIVRELVDFEDIDTITLYLNAKRQEVFYEYILSLNPKRIIFNPGTENPELYQLLDSHNISYEESCTLVLLHTDQF